MKYHIISNSEQETKQIAKSISTLLHSDDLVILDGDLGTGKTYFVKGFAEGLGSSDLVTSPTFSIANFYDAESLQLLHIDLYRISSIEEFYDLGLSDYFQQTIVIIEWGKKFADYFEEYLLVSIEYINDENDSRDITFSFKGKKYENIMNLFCQKLPNLLPC